MDQLNPVRHSAGVDIAIGYGVDSWFEDNSYRDPWYQDSVVRLADAVVNHDVVEFPLPTNKAVANLSEDSLPEAFSEGRKSGVLRPFVATTAEDIEVVPANIAGEYDRFLDWGRRNAHDLAVFVTYHRTSGRIATAHELEFNPTYYVSDFWNRTVLGLSLPSWWSGSSSGLEYAFDIFLRATQYNLLFGKKAAYISHTVRDEAAVLWAGDGEDAVATAKFQDCFAWGNYFLYAREHLGYPKNQGQFLEALAALREAAANVGAVRRLLPSKLDSKSLERIEVTASQAKLPAKIREDVLKRIQKVLTGGSAAVGTIGTAASGSSPEVGLVAAAALISGVLLTVPWGGHVPADMVRLPGMRSIIQFPGLSVPPGTPVWSPPRSV